MKYDTCYNPDAYFEKSSKVHAFLNDDITQIVCGQKVSLAWAKVELAKVDCKKCLKIISIKQ